MIKVIWRSVFGACGWLRQQGRRVAAVRCVGSTGAFLMIGSPIPPLSGHHLDALCPSAHDFSNYLPIVVPVNVGMLIFSRESFDHGRKKASRRRTCGSCQTRHAHHKTGRQDHEIRFRNAPPQTFHESTQRSASAAVALTMAMRTDITVSSSSRSSLDELRRIKLGCVSTTFFSDDMHTYDFMSHSPCHRYARHKQS